ncbi:MAG TPA: alpha/beta fold hydrolase [Dehalococcoidia bacterium]|nr:alpha/beta fold hydrolase [Dehalococcoidia bacterium]
MKDCSRLARDMRKHLQGIAGNIETMIYRFDDCQLDTQLFELRRSGTPQQLEPQVFDVLAYLVQNADRVVTKDELFEKVWGDKFISEAALNSRLMAARRAIGDNGRDQRLIRTLHGRGFRFVGELRDGAVNEIAGPDLETPVNELAAQVSELKQEVRFCKASDGVQIAYATVGSGPPLVKSPNWLTHIEYEWQSPVWRHWWEALARDYTLIRFDQRGSGLSDRDVEDMSFEAWVRDLETVVDAAKVTDFNLLGISQGGPVAIEYAIRHPERVRKLILYGAYAQGRLVRGESAKLFDAILTVMHEGWGRDNPAYRQMFTSQFMPDATAEQMRWFNDLQRVSTSGENAARIQMVGSNIDVLDRLPLVTVPTLVIHAAGDERVPFAQGRLIASTLPNARLVSIESRNHLTLEDEPAWQRLISEVRAFIEEPVKS